MSITSSNSRHLQRLAARAHITPLLLLVTACSGSPVSLGSGLDSRESALQVTPWSRTQRRMSRHRSSRWRRPARIIRYSWGALRQTERRMSRHRSSRWRRPARIIRCSRGALRQTERRIALAIHCFRVVPRQTEATDPIPATEWSPGPGRPSRPAMSPNSWQASKPRCRPLGGPRGDALDHSSLRRAHLSKSLCRGSFEIHLEHPWRRGRHFADRRT